MRILKHILDNKLFLKKIDLESRNYIVGHNEINPILRTKCPGSKFPFDRIINTLKENIY